MDLIVNLKDGTQHKIRGYNLKECGIYEKTFFIESLKDDRFEFLINSLSTFSLDRPKFEKLAPQAGDSVVLNTAVIILSTFLP